MPVLPFIDGRFIAQTFALRRKVCPPATVAGPLFPGSQAYGSVLRDRSGQWRMWYLVFRDYCEYFATSRDGLSWEQPALDLVSPQVRPTCPTPNAFMSHHQRDAQGRWLVTAKGPEGFSVLDAEETPHPAARSRFTALYLGRLEGAGGGEVSGLCLAHSDDGVHWLADERNPVLPGWRDTANQLLWDERRRRYVWYGRPAVHVSAVVPEANRLIARAESEDLVHWSPERVVLDTDEADADGWDLVDEAALGEGLAVADAEARARRWAEVLEGVPTNAKAPRMRGRNRQWYGITVFPWADLYLGLGWLYDVPSGTISIELLHSYDGLDWRREPLRRPFLTPAPGTCAVTMSTPPVVVGDEVRLYWSHGNYNHHHVAAPGVVPGLRMSSLPRDRWVAYAAGEQEGELLTHVLPRPEHLALNAAVEHGGSIRAELLDPDGLPLPGRTLAESEPVTGDGLALPLRWRGREAALDPGEGAAGVRLRLTCRRARVYGVGV